MEIADQHEAWWVQGAKIGYMEITDQREEPGVTSSEK